MFVIQQLDGTTVEVKNLSIMIGDAHITKHKNTMNCSMIRIAIIQLD